MADQRSALARAQLAVFEATATREYDSLHVRLAAGPPLSRIVRWSAVFAAAWSGVQLVAAILEPFAHRHGGVRRSTAEAIVLVCILVREVLTVVADLNGRSRPS